MNDWSLWSHCPPKGKRHCSTDIKYLTLCYLSVCLSVSGLQSCWSMVISKLYTIVKLFCCIFTLFVSIWTSDLIGCYIFMCDIKLWMPHIQTVQLPAVVHFYLIKIKKTPSKYEYLFGQLTIEKIDFINMLLGYRSVYIIYNYNTNICSVDINKITSRIIS